MTLRLYLALGLLILLAGAFVWARRDAVQDARDQDRIIDQDTAIEVQDGVSDILRDLRDHDDVDGLLDADGGLRDSPRDR